jgi:uncharacterized protein
VCGFRRLCGAGGPLARTVLLVLAIVLGCGAAGAAAIAQTQPTAAPVPPSPPPPPSTIVVFGDSQAQGLAGGLQRVLIEDPQYRVMNRTHPGAALVHDESEWLRPVENFTARDKADIAVVMFGANDRLDLRDDDGSYLRFRTDEWRAAYAGRIDAILTLLTKAGLRIVWCGNPIARSETYSDDMDYINTIYANEVKRFGGQFVSLWTVIADDQGRYSAYGKDSDGTTERMRADDGIHFTAPGYELIAEKIVALLAAPVPPPGNAAAAAPASAPAAAPGPNAVTPAAAAAATTPTPGAATAH